MTKNELIVKLSKRTGIEEFIVRTIVDTFADEVSKQLINGESVHMRGFGTFSIKHCAQKMGRNINKKQVVLIPAHDQPAFKPADALKASIKERTKKEVVLPI
jgi:DNA-binding protein HU-beta